MAVVPTSADDVFINCLFDDAFAPTFRALIFAIIVCGFRPRSARELDDGGQTRIDKIYGLIEECALFSISSRIFAEGQSRVSATGLVSKAKSGATFQGLDQPNAIPNFCLPLSR